VIAILAASPSGAAFDVSPGICSVTADNCHVRFRLCESACASHECDGHFGGIAEWGCLQRESKHMLSNGR